MTIFVPHYVYHNSIQNKIKKWTQQRTFSKLTFEKVTFAHLVPDHHSCILIIPVIPFGGEPWYATQIIVANGLKFLDFLPDCMAQTVKFSVFESSIHDVTAS